MNMPDFKHYNNFSSDNNFPRITIILLIPKIYMIFLSLPVKGHNEDHRRHELSPYPP